MRGNTERRRYPRLEKNLPIKIRTQDFDIVTQTKDISGDGVYCQIDKHIAPMTKLDVVLMLPVSKKKVVKIQCGGVVARISEVPECPKPAFNIAIFFNQIANSEADNINKYVSKNLKKENQPI